MSGFSMEQPVTVTGLGVAQPMPYFGPQMSVTGRWPSGHVGVYDSISTERPCGGYGGYDAAANESRRLMAAGWNSPTLVMEASRNLPLDIFSESAPLRSVLEGQIKVDNFYRELHQHENRIAEQRSKEFKLERGITSASRIDIPKAGQSWGPKIDYGNGLWEKKHTTRDETLIGYTPYGSHTHIGSDFVSVRDEKSGRGIRWQL